MSRASLYAWRARLSGERTSAQRPCADAFLPVTVNESKPSDSRGLKGPVEIVTHSGRVVRVHGEPDEHALYAVMKVAERC